MPKERPVLVQATEGPILRYLDRGQSILRCSGCDGSVLVEGYKEECLVGIGLECSKCGHITWTPSRPQGEIFPLKPIVLTSGRKYRIESTLEVASMVAIISDREAALERAEMAPKSAQKERLELSPRALDTMAAELNQLSDNRFKDSLASAERAIDGGQRYFRKSPLAWALTYVSRQLDKGVLRAAEEDTRVALGLIICYTNVLHNWRNHPHIQQLAKELCAHFHHTLAQLIAADYLHGLGNRITFNPPGAAPSADLYVRLTVQKRLYLEVKAPRDIEWPNRISHHSEMKRIVQKCLSDAKKQINSNKPEILIISSSNIAPNFTTNFATSIQSMLNSSGFKHKAVAAVAILNILDSFYLDFLRSNGFSHSFEFNYDLISMIHCLKNPYYFEENPIADTLPA